MTGGCEGRRAPAPEVDADEDFMVINPNGGGNGHLSGRKRRPRLWMPRLQHTRHPQKPTPSPPSTTQIRENAGAADAKSKSQFAVPDSGSATGLATSPFLSLHQNRRSTPYPTLSRRLQNCITETYRRHARLSGDRQPTFPRRWTPRSPSPGAEDPCSRLKRSKTGRPTGTLPQRPDEVGQRPNH